MQEFGMFQSNIVPTVDKLLILGDFNIHVCCPSHHLVKEFLQLIDSFDLIQHINGPTHEHGHTIDLVLTYGLSVCNIDIKPLGSKVFLGSLRCSDMP